MKARPKADGIPHGADPGGNEQDAVERDIDDLLHKLSDERDALQDRLLRTMADFQNFRKRQEEQRRQLEQFATERLVSALLPVLDNFDRAIASFDAGATAESIIEGLRLVDKDLRRVLEGQNVTRIDAVGREFDPEVHEAIAMEPTDEFEDNTVIAELEPGYRMGDKVLRPARVRVAKRP